MVGGVVLYFLDRCVTRDVDSQAFRTCDGTANASLLYRIFQTEYSMSIVRYFKNVKYYQTLAWTHMSDIHSSLFHVLQVLNVVATRSTDNIKPI